MIAEDLKIGLVLMYGEEEVTITEISKARISLKCTKEVWGYGNIPLYECRLGNKLTNMEMLRLK